MPPVSAAPLAKKMLLKPGTHALLLGVPDDVARQLDAVPGVTVSTGAQGDAKPGFALAFATTKADVDALAGRVFPRVPEDAVVWFAWPKKASGIATDLTRDTGWASVWEHGWEGVATVSIDDVWSGMRFRPSGKVKAVGTKRVRPPAAKAAKARPKGAKAKGAKKAARKGPKKAAKRRAVKRRRT